MIYRLEHDLHIDRLGYMLLHTGFFGCLLILLKGIGGHRNDRNRRLVLILKGTYKLCPGSNTIPPDLVIY